MRSVVNEQALDLLREPVAVWGLGVEGRATVEFLKRLGVSDVTGLDQQKIPDLPKSLKTILGQKHDRDLWRFATIFRSPGIRPDHPSLEEARSHSTLVTSATDLFLRLCPAPVVGITGTVGKGTAASLTASIFGRGGFTVHLGGNIGKSPLEFLDAVEPDHRVVLEISSFQAMDLTDSPQVAVILKTTCEHLDWHKSQTEYRESKANLVAGQRADDLMVYNADSQGAIQIAANSKARKIAYSTIDEVNEGLFLQDNRLVLRHAQEEQILPIDPAELHLKGAFNLENVAAAILASTGAGASVQDACEASAQFKGLPHRLELVTQGKNIRYYNDSYATRPEATLGALSSFTHEPLALILGGSEKHVDFSDLARAIVEKPNIVQVCLIGQTAERLARSIEDAGARHFSLSRYDNLEPAVEGAARSLPQGGVVLLSPACASFGLFQNYKVRGERFRAKALDLA